MTCRCPPVPRPPGVRWVPANKIGELMQQRLSNPHALDAYPLEPMETFNDPVAHRAFLKRIGELRDDRKG